MATKLLQIIKKKKQTNQVYDEEKYELGQNVLTSICIYFKVCTLLLSDDLAHLSLGRAKSCVCFVLDLISCCLNQAIAIFADSGSCVKC